MAQLLVDSGERVELLILFDTVNPLLAAWSHAERVRTHWANLRAGGPRYVADRAADRLSRMAGYCTMRIRARLATRRRYRYRLEALMVAGLHAQSAYRPSSYGGDVLLVQGDALLSAGGGIGHKPHESNGWREYIGGRLDVATVPASHLDMMDGAAAQLTAAVVRRTLRKIARIQSAAGA